IRARHQARRRDRADQSYRRRIRPAPPVRNLFRAAGAPARLAAGIPLRPLGLLGRPPRRRARDRTARHAAARAFFADPFRAPGRWRAPQRGLSRMIPKRGYRFLTNIMRTFSARGPGAPFDPPGGPGCDPDSADVAVWARLL